MSFANQAYVRVWNSLPTAFIIYRYGGRKKSISFILSVRYVLLKCQCDCLSCLTGSVKESWLSFYFIFANVGGWTCQWLSKIICLMRFADPDAGAQILLQTELYTRYILDGTVAQNALSVFVIFLRNLADRMCPNESKIELLAMFGHVSSSELCW